MKVEAHIRLIFTVLALLTCCFTISAQEPEQPDVYEQAEAEADRLQRVLDLEDWQVFYVDSTLKHDFPAMMAEYDKLRNSKVSNTSLYIAVQDKWMDHIDAMDQLRKGISLRGYGNVDPVLEYKKEGFEMFEDLVESIQDDTVTVLLKAELRRVQVKPVAPANLATNRTDGSGPMPRKQAPTGVPGRNDQCPCGSGKKYKNCCGAGK